MTYGTPLGADQLNARASTPGKFTYTPAEGKILTAGTHTLSVIFTPTDADNYSIHEQMCWVEVLKAVPTLTWSDPGVISYGTALSARQLNATASIPGTFSYIPAVGAVLGAGRHTPSCDLFSAGFNQLHGWAGSRIVDCLQGRANHHMAGSCANFLWDGADGQSA